MGSYRPTVSHEWTTWWYPDDTTAQGCAEIIRISKEAEGENSLKIGSKEVE